MNTALVVGVIEAKRAFGLLVQIKRVTDMDGIYERGLLASNLVSIPGGDGEGAWERGEKGKRSDFQ